MKVRNILLLSCLSVMLAGSIFYGCKRKKESFIGPEYLSAPSDISATIVSLSNNVNFTTDSCYLVATFSTRVSYTVTYRGLSSGATKTFSAVGSGVALGDAAHIWNGSQSGTNFFRSGENVEVTISFFRSTYTVKDTMTITTKRNVFSNPNYLPFTTNSNNSYEGAEIGYPSQFSFASINPSCPGTIIGSISTYGGADGGKAFQIKGTSCQADGYFIGGLQHRKTGFYMPAAWTDPSQIYFNIYIYGTGKTNGRLSLEFGEADLSNDASKPKLNCVENTSIPIGEHDSCTDDAYGIQVSMNHVGWKLVSVKYSDMVKSGTPIYGGSGNGIKEPTRVQRIQIGVLSIPTPKDEINAIWDFPVFSYGAPFDPTK